MATIQDVKRIAKQLSKKAAASKQDVLTLDTEPQANSARPLTSGAVHSSIAALTASLDGKQNVINPGGLVTDRAVVFNVKQNGGVTNFKSYLTAVSTGTGQYTGSNGLSTLFTNNTLGVVYDLEDSDNNDSNAPYKPGSSTDRFDKWEYYYLYHVTNELKNLGFDNTGALGWPVIKDDG